MGLPRSNDIDTVEDAPNEDQGNCVHVQRIVTEQFIITEEELVELGIRPDEVDWFEKRKPEVEEYAKEYFNPGFTQSKSEVKLTLATDKYTALKRRPV